MLHRRRILIGRYRASRKMVNIKSIWSNSSAGSGLPVDLDSDPEPNDESPHKRRETRSRRQRQQTSASASAVALVSTSTVIEEEKQKTHLGGVATATAAFVSSLFSLISDIAEVNPDVINWICNGEAFIVYDKENKELLGKCLEQYFNHNRYSSFQRQLNMYGFKKHIAGKYKGAFHHPLFHRDDNSCFHLIRRNASQLPRPRRYSSSSSHKTPPVSAKSITSGAKKRSKRIAAAAAKKKEMEMKKKKKTSNSLVSTEHHLVTPTENSRRNLRSKKNEKVVSTAYVPVQILPKMQAQEEGLKPLESYQNKHIMSSPYFFSNQLSMLCDSNLSDAQDLAAPAFVSPAVDKYNRAFVTPKAVNLDDDKDDENNSLYDDFFNVDKDKILLSSSVAVTDATQMKSSQETKETKADKDHLFGLIPILQNNVNETSSSSFVLTPRLRSLVLPQPSQQQQQQQLSFSSRSTNTNTSTTFLPSSPLITSDKKKRKREDLDDDDEVVAAFGAKVFLESNFDSINSNSNLFSSQIQCIDDIDTLSLNTWDEEGEEMSK